MISRAETEVYSKLFHIAKDNMESAGREMAPAEESFLITVGIAPDTADLLRLHDLDKRAYVQAAYAALLRRFPEDRARTVWESKERMSDEKYRRFLLTTLVRSGEYTGKGIQLYNNYYPGIPGVSYLRKIYSKMPTKVKKLIKKILR